MPSKLVKTQCARDCPDACFMDVEVQDGKVVSVNGGRDNPVTNGFLCPRGIGDSKRIYSEKRVLYPRVRTGHKPGAGFSRVSWDQALSVVGDRLSETLEEYGPESVLLLDYSGNTGLISSQLGTRLWSAIGATHTDHAICSRSGHEALKLHYGLSYGVSPESLLRKKIITFWGFNAKVSSAHQWSLAMKAHENGALIVVVDSRRSESAEAADLWLSPRPGSDVALAYGVARCLIELGYIDEEFIDKHTVGFNLYREEVLRWTPHIVESITGIKQMDVESLAELYAERRPGAVMMGIGFQKSIQGAEAVRAVSLLPALLGEHRGFSYTNSKGRLIDYDYLSGSAQTGGGWKTVSQTSLGGHLRDGEFRFVYVVGMNPALTLPDLAAVRRGLLRDDVFVVVHDTHMTETCDYADVVLPAATFFEKEDVVVSDSHPYTRFNHRCVELVGESRPEVWVMKEMTGRLGRGEAWLYEDPLEALKKAFEGAIEEGTPHVLQEGATFKVSERSREAYQTPSGKIEFYSSIAKEGIAPLPCQLSVEVADGSFILLNSALPQWTHSQFRDVYGEIPQIVWVNAEDAERLEIRDGDTVVLHNDLGEIEVTASVGDRVKSGILWSPRPLIDRLGRPQNQLIQGMRQALGGGPHYSSVVVRVRHLDVA